MPPRGQRRTTTGLNRLTAHGDHIRAQLAADPMWQVTTADGRWICPFCLSTVRAPAGQEGRSHLARAIERHLTGRCPAWRDGRGQTQPLEALHLQAQHEDIGHRAMTDPAWQVFDHEGCWYSPSSLKKVPGVRISTGRLDNFVIQQMVRHVGNCQDFLSGRMHSVREVQAARDKGMRVDKLATDIEKLLGHPIWRHRDSADLWICPYCLDHIPTVRASGDREWRELTRRMARHLLGGCGNFGPGQNRIQDEKLVRQAAQDPPPAMPVDDDPPTRYTRSGSHATPIATPLGLPKGLTPAVGSGVGQQSGKRVAPIAKAMGQGSASSRTPVLKPDLAPDEESAEVQLKPGRASGPREAVPVAEEVDDQPAPLFGRTRASELLAGSFLDQDVVLPENGIEGDGSGAFADLVGDGFVPGSAGSDGFQAEPAGDNPLAWMDEVGNRGEHTPSSATPSEHHTDMMRARDVQINMLRQAPEIPGFRFGSRFESCAAVSGDFYEYIELADGRIGFAQGDVSGHGMQAGLIMSMAKKVLAIFARQQSSPAKVLAAVNDALVEDLQGKMFVSMTYAVLDPGERTVTWARAGHNPTIRFNIHSKEITEINPPGMVVGMKAGPLFAKVAKEEVTRVQSGDVFLVYTDGVTETMNRQGEEYGLDLLKELIVSHADGHVDRLLDRILDSVRGFRGGLDPQDDMTLLAMVVD